MTGTRHNTRPVQKRKPREESDKLEVDRFGALHVNGSMRYVVGGYTPAAGDITNGPCDGLLLSADATVTFRPAEGDAEVSLFFAGGMWHPQACIKVTAVSGGAAIALGWYRNPTTGT